MNTARPPAREVSRAGRPAENFGRFRRRSQTIGRLGFRFGLIRANGSIIPEAQRHPRRDRGAGGDYINRMPHIGVTKMTKTKTLILAAGYLAIGVALGAMPASAGSNAPAPLDGTVITPAASTYVVNQYGCQIIPQNGNYERPNYWVRASADCVNPGGADDIAVTKAGTPFDADRFCERVDVRIERFRARHDPFGDRIADRLEEQRDENCESGKCS